LANFENLLQTAVTASACIVATEKNAQFVFPEVNFAVEAQELASYGGVPKEPSEDEEAPLKEKLPFTEKDIELVMNQTNASKEKSIDALKKNNGDIVSAIMELSERK
jgi:nascent polypeptide-associated complex subunit alpha